MIVKAAVRARNEIRSTTLLSIIEAATRRGPS